MKRLSASLFAAVFLSIVLYAQENAYITHTVKWFESINSISAKYGVPVDIIVAVNGLSEPVVSTRQQLLIPTDEKYWPAIEEGCGDHAQAIADSLSGMNPVHVTAMPSERMSIGLVMPFSAGSQAQRNNVLDFYSGVLMAVREMGLDGMDISLNVRDSAADDMPMGAYESDDIVIGPFRYTDITAVRDALGESTILVSPLDQKTSSLAAMDRMLVQAPSNLSYQFEAVPLWEDGDNYIVISCESDTTVLNDAKAALEKEGIAYKECTCSVQNEIGGWDTAYSESGVNKVILAITSEAVLNNAVRNMCIEESKGNVICYAPNKVTSYESIPVENIHRAHMRVLSSYYVDYSDPETLDFVHKYRALYKSEPSQFAFQGHDLAVFLAKTFRKYGKAWEYLVSDEPQMDLLQSSFKLRRLEDGGLVNTAARKVEYRRDYKVQLIK